jgi:tight adherence protein B
MTPLSAALFALLLTFGTVMTLGTLIPRKGGTARARLRKLETQPATNTAGTGDADRLPTVTKWLSDKSVTERINMALLAGGLRIRPSEFVGIIAGLVILTQLAAALLSSSILMHMALIVIAVIMPIIVLKARQEKRRLAFDAQIVDALTMISSSIRSGFSFLRAMQLVAQEMPSPISEEFQRAIDEMNVGRSTEDALRALVCRVRSSDFDLVVTAVVIQLQVGGNLAEILDTISSTVRERMRITGETKALTAESKLSGIVLVLLPIGVGLLMSVVNPDYIATLVHDNLGRHMIIGAVLMQIIGALIIRRMLVLDI